LKTWSDEAAAVLPGLAVRIVKTPSDLRRPAQLYILSREDAKLGHGYRGIEGHCPRCGTFLLTSAATNASRRLRCKAISRRPRNRAGRLAVFLGTLLAPSFPEHALTADLPALRRRLQGPVRPLPTSRLLDFHDHLVQEIAALFETSDADEEQATLLPVAKLLLRFAAVFQTRSRALPLLKGLLGRGEPSTWGPHAWIRSVVETLENPETEEPTDPTKEILRVLEVLHSLAVWEESPPCGEPLYQAIPQPRRFPLAKVIQRRHASLFDLVVLDEAHEFNNPGSAQSNAAHRLSGLPGVPTLLLSGSLMGGFASSVFTNFWALSRAFREEFDRGDRAAFIDRYGFRRILVSHDGEASTLQTRRFGSQTDREIDSRMTVLGEAPGLMPEFLLRHLLPVAVFIQKADLEVKLPPPIEILSPLTFPSDDAFAPELYAEYRRLQERLLERIRRDRFDPQRSGRLLGALVEMPSYLDLATDDLPPFEIRYPEHLDSELVALGRAFPASWRTPKEVWLLERVAANLRQGNRVLVFLRHTGTPSLPARLLRLLREVTPRAAWLDAKKVSTADREAWIDENVVGKDVQVLLVNPNAVKTGLNNLVCFSTALWYELDLSAYTLRQAPGRLHRIGQTRQVEIETAYYAGTTQEVMLEHVASKVTVSLQADALDLQSALEALGASDAQNTALSTALSLGEAVYRSLNRT
jgi:hypothetical protein